METVCLLQLYGGRVWRAAIRLYCCTTVPHSAEHSKASYVTVLRCAALHCTTIKEYDVSCFMSFVPAKLCNNRRNINERFSLFDSHNRTPYSSVFQASGSWSTNLASSLGAFRPILGAHLLNVRRVRLYGEHCSLVKYVRWRGSLLYTRIVSRTLIRRVLIPFHATRLWWTTLFEVKCVDVLLNCSSASSAIRRNYS